MRDLKQCTIAPDGRVLCIKKWQKKAELQMGTIDVYSAVLKAWDRQLDTYILYI
jgi:hypothetical protein